MKKIFAVYFFILCVIFVSGQKNDSLEYVRQLKADVFQLASEDYTGRYPGTKGSNKASAYIFRQFKKAGLDVTINNGYQFFDFTSSIEPTKANLLMLGNFKATFEKDFIVYPYSNSDTVSGNLVFGGFGIELRTDSIQWHDYENIDVKGKCVIIFKGDPDYNKSVTAFAGIGGDREKVLLAKEKGALAVIFVSPYMVDSHDDFYQYKNYQGDAGIPVIQVKRYVADSILKYAHTSVAEIEKNFRNLKRHNSFDIPFKIELTTGLKVKMEKAKNVIGLIPGTDKILKNEFIVVGAHYDHLGKVRTGNSDKEEINYGADDNASGVAAILGIARKLLSKSAGFKRSILFIAFDGEEEGLLGSKYFISNPLVPLQKVKIMLNFDMVGRLNTDRELQIYGTGTFKESDSILKIQLKSYNFKTVLNPDGNGPSDYASFYGKNIPVIAFFTGLHPDYHKPLDTPDKINYGGIYQIVELADNIITDLANSNQLLTFKQSSNTINNRNFRRGKVTLGIMPDFSGVTKGGLKVDGVTKGKPADKAGIIKDDIILAINEVPIKDIYEYMFQMGKYNAGDKITVQIKRGDKILILEVNL